MVTLIATPSTHFSLIDPGFQEQIYDVYRFLPPTTQVQCSSSHVTVM